MWVLLLPYDIGPHWNHPFHFLVQALFGFFWFFFLHLWLSFNLLAYSFILGLHCCTWAFSGCREWRLLCVVVHSSLTAAASLAAEHRFLVHKLQQLRLPGSRAWAQELWFEDFSCSMLCGIFPDQGSNLCPLHWQVDSYPLHHWGSPSGCLSFLFFVHSFFSNSYISLPLQFIF